ncbi:MAG TPA: TonB-dependent receptor, partial [Alphaproteobacteria bacterium]|nr:TonB-dependent receptor [Alphaproteobacteria bacterium]
ILRGNPNVKPEKSDTSTIGVVLQPGGVLDGLQFAADYYRISLKDGIAPGGGQQTALLDACRQVNADTCTTDLGTVDWLTPRGADPATWQWFNLYEGSYNASSYKVKGIDFSLTYNHQFANMDNVNVRVLATKTISQVVMTAIGTTPTPILGQTGIGNLFLPDFQSSPDWTANLSVTYTHGGFSGTVQGRYISAGSYDYLGAAPGDPNYGAPGYTTYSTNHIGFYQIYNMTLSYTFQDLVGDNSSLQLFVTVNNLFDRDPPSIGSANYYDRLGRRFRFGIRAAF